MPAVFSKKGREVLTRLIENLGGCGQGKEEGAECVSTPRLKWWTILDLNQYWTPPHTLDYADKWMLNILAEQKRLPIGIDPPCERPDF